MRSDMWKVIVERPRLGRAYADARGRRAQKLLPHDPDGDTLSVTERFERSKHLNENLAPLRRYLERQVGRPWDKVYSEMRAHISFDNVVQKHVFAHLQAFIELRPQIVGDAIYREDGGPLESRRRCQLYVHPRTGIIRRVEHARRVANQKREDFASLGPRACLLRVDGIWWHITLAPTPAQNSLVRVKPVVDVVTKRAPETAYWSRPDTWHRYGAPKVYAAAKRQASKRELRAHRRADRIR